MDDDFHVPEITFRLVVGAALLVVAVVTFVAQDRIRRRAGRADRPKHRLLVYSGGSSGEQPCGFVDVSGTVVSPPSLRAPVSGRACALWELSLYAVIPETEYSPQRYDHLWITARSGDLVVTYDERWYIRPTPGSERPAKNASGGGRLEVPGDKVSFRPPDLPNSPHLPGLSWFHSSGYQPADPVLLQRLGPPEELLARVRANPRAYVVTEGSVATGEFIRLAQRSATPIAGPNPSEPFFLNPMSRESIGAFGIGCLAKVSTLFAVTAAVVGAAMVYSGWRKPPPHTDGQARRIVSWSSDIARLRPPAHPEGTGARRRAGRIRIASTLSPIASLELIRCPGKCLGVLRARSDVRSCRDPDAFSPTAATAATMLRRLRPAVRSFNNVFENRCAATKSWHSDAERSLSSWRTVHIRLLPPSFADQTPAKI